MSRFSSRQVAILESQFNKDNYVTPEMSLQLSDEFNVPTKMIQNWFRSRRRKSVQQGQTIVIKKENISLSKPPKDCLSPLVTNASVKTEPKTPNSTTVSLRTVKSDSLSTNNPKPKIWSPINQISSAAINVPKIMNKGVKVTEQPGKKVEQKQVTVIESDESSIDVEAEFVCEFSGKKERKMESFDDDFEKDERQAGNVAPAGYCVREVDEPEIKEPETYFPILPQAQIFRQQYSQQLQYIKHLDMMQRSAVFQLNRIQQAMRKFQP